MSGYRGYLQSHLDRISSLAGQGLAPPEIARTLYQEGVRPPQKQLSPLPPKESVRSLTAAVRHALRRNAGVEAE